MRFDHSNDWFYKYPDDSFGITYDFTNDVSSDTVATATVTIENESGTDKTASMISNTQVSSPDVTFTIGGGTGGETYFIKIRALTDTSAYFTHYLNCEVYGTATLNTKLGDISCNSYVTVAEADDYIRNTYGHGSAWDTLSLEGKKRVLIQAARDLEVFNYIGEKYYDSQGLQFPRNDHDIVTGNCATPLTINSFKNTSLYSTTYGEIPTNYWKYGSCHITSATPANDVRVITSSNSSTGVVTMVNNFTATPSSTAQFVVFAPLHKEVKDAQCEQAVFLVQNRRVDSLTSYKEMGVERVDIGDTSVVFGEKTMSTVAVATKARKLLGRWIRKSFRVGRG